MGLHKRLRQMVDANGGTIGAHEAADSLGVTVVVLVGSKATKRLSAVGLCLKYIDCQYVIKIK